MGGGSLAQCTKGIGKLMWKRHKINDIPSLIMFPCLPADKPEPVSYECQWSGDWSPVPGCAIEVDVNYLGSNLYMGNANGALRQKDAYACQAFCRSRGNKYFKWYSPEYNTSIVPPFACYCKDEVTGRRMRTGIISGAASNCGVDCASSNASPNCTNAGS